MAGGLLVAVSYPVDDEFVQISTGVLDGLADVAFLDGRPDTEFRDTLRRADVLIDLGRSPAPHPRYRADRPRGQGRLLRWRGDGGG